MWQYNYNYSSNYLSHHGVMGMKWGIRRDRSSSGGISKRQRRAEKQINKYKGDVAKAASNVEKKGVRKARITGNLLQTASGVTGAGLILATMNPMLGLSVGTVAAGASIATRKYMEKKAKQNAYDVIEYGKSHGK